MCADNAAPAATTGRPRSAGHAGMRRGFACAAISERRKLGLPRGLRDRLEALGRRRGFDLGEVIRRALRQYRSGRLRVANGPRRVVATRENRVVISYRAPSSLVGDLTGADIRRVLDAALRQAERRERVLVASIEIAPEDAGVAYEERERGDD